MSDTEKKEPITLETQISEGSVYDIVTASGDQIQYLMSLLGYTTQNQPEIEDKDFQILLHGIHTLTLEEAREIVSETIVEHENDRNFPPVLYAHFKESLEYGEKDVVMEGVTGEWALKCCAGIMHYSSPYPEVRSCTHFYDDPEEHCETLRVYFLATIWLIISTFVNQFFSIRMPAISIPGALGQLLIIPCGQFLAKVTPDWSFTIFGTKYRLNPGPWSYKEQSFFLIILGEGGLPYGDAQILVQKLPMFYGNEWAGPGYQLILMLSTQFLGFGLAGIFRNLLVYPAKNIWMTNFPSIATNEALMRPDNKNSVHGWKLTRYACFGIFFAIMFVYAWFPIYIMEFLQYFNWMTWIAPNNFNLAAITGSIDGLGLNPISTFDWSNLSAGGPLVSPFFAYVNTYVGVLFGGLVIIGIYYTNMYNTAYLPINSNSIFTNTGELFKVQEVLTNNVLDEAKYQAYSPPYYSAANLVTFGAFFAAYTSLYVTILLSDWKVMWESLKELYLMCLGRGKSVHDYNDPHSRMMQKYKETPQWWFIVVLLIALALGIATLRGFPTAAPVWGIFLALGLSIVFLVPISILYSQTNNLMSINVLTELIVGYALPGHGTALMLIKAFGVNTNLQAVSFMNDLKVAAYTKVPPRAAFRAQIWATLVCVLVTLGVLQFQLTSIDGICTKAQLETTRFTCPGETTYFSSSVIWGVIGPKRIFSAEYPLLKWCFLIGCFIPLPFYFAKKFFPKSRKYLSHIEPNLILMGMISGYAPLNMSYFMGGLYLSWVFMRHIKNKYTLWFVKYNYVLNSALSTGYAIAGFIIFWAVQYHTKDLDWWGNTVSFNGIDGAGAALLEIPEQGYFGRAPGTYDF